MQFILQDGFWVVHILLVHMVKSKYLAQFPVDTLPNSVMYNLRFFLPEFAAFTYMWFILSFLSPHNLHLLFYYVLSIFASIYLVLMVLFCAAIIIIIIIIIIFTLCEFFIPILTGGFPLKFKWHQFSSGLQDSSKYSRWFQQCCGLNDLGFSSDLHFSSLFGGYYY